jgi:hypothetical protein
MENPSAGGGGGASGGGGNTRYPVLCISCPFCVGEWFGGDLSGRRRHPRGGSGRAFG